LGQPAPQPCGRGRGGRGRALRRRRAPDHRGDRDLESAADAERLRALHAQIEAAVVAADYTGYERISGRNDRTTWCWWAAPAAELVRGARVAADRLNPGWWQIEADDY
jgi:hypothetical protein